MIADLHIHSRFSRGCSKDLNIKNLEKYARLKGIELLGTGDFTHPEWLKELRSNLEEDGSGLLRTSSGFPFALQTEISLIYTQGRGRKVHNVVLAPDLDAVEQINHELGRRGRLDYDGRPIFKIPCPEFVEMLRGISKDIEVIPAHIWTPWFSMFGSNSGFDSVAECFGDQARHVHAVETGLSSDPPMNWRLSQLDRMRIVSFSDSHSYWPWRMGREATDLNMNESYPSLLQALRSEDGVKRTIEVDPNYGKYHYDGHRSCGVVMHPHEASANNKICPVCRKPLTIGVLHRVEELADRPEDYLPSRKTPFLHLLPLHELLADTLGRGVATAQVWKEYNKILSGGNEFDILLNASRETLAERTSEQIAEQILLNRQGKINVTPGYDGVYGSIAGKNPPLTSSTYQNPYAKNAGRNPRPSTKPAQKGLSDYFA